MQTRSKRAKQPGYAEWLTDLKGRILAAKHRAVLGVNRELVLLYWQIGRDILDRQARQGGGARILERLARDFRAAYSETIGFSRTNLLHMRAFAQAWPDPAIVEQVLGQLPWEHHLVLLAKLQTADERLVFAVRAIEHGWSRSVLAREIERREREENG